MGVQRRTVVVSGILLAVLVTAGGVLATAHGGGSRHFGREADELLPDLVTAPVRDLYAQQYGGARLLRFTHEIENLGRGPLEIHPLAGSCPSPRSAGPTYQGQQWIYRDTNHDGRFERDIDRQVDRKIVTCLIYHQQHQHWHIDSFVSYNLYRPFDDQPVRTSGKVSFCVVDTEQLRPDLPGSPPASYFQVADALPGDCEQHTTIGLSVGYGDLYHADLVDQWIDITNLRSGVYCLVTRTDVHNFIPETDETNNDRRTPIQITAKGAHLLPPGTECAA